MVTCNTNLEKSRSIFLLNATKKLSLICGSYEIDAFTSESQCYSGKEHGLIHNFKKKGKGSLH